MLPEYRNEPLTNFADPAQKAAYEQALATVRSRFGREIPLVIGGERLTTGNWIESTNPSKPSEVLARVASAGKAEVDKSFAAAQKAFHDWSRWPAEARARTLLRAAAIIRRRKHEFSATMTLEAGKNWAEADADTAEAIDFLEFYAREMMRLAGPQPLTPVEGEENHLYYLPMGVGLVIPPWNFPLAILCGMTSAAIVTGNTVLVKPASPTPVIAWELMQVFEEAGVPPGVINFIPGDGGEIGDYMVMHKDTAFVNFTGSKAVGLHINEMAGKTAPGQRGIKRVVAEMGGKDAILVDETADLDAAAEGVVVSAFGFQGQKCSACSRLVIVDSVYDELLAKVIERAKQLTVGPAEDNPDVGPVIEERAMQRIMRYIEQGKQEGELVLGGERAPGDGWFLQPTIFKDVDANAVIAQEEIFGPVLAVIRARDFDHGIEIVNGTEYGLTGSVYSRDRARIEQARREFHVGNLYINRKCTGALVGAQPFGGFNMSGTDSKAGGRDYLLLFLQAKTVVERF